MTYRAPLSVWRADPELICDFSDGSGKGQQSRRPYAIIVRDQCFENGKDLLL